MICVSFHFVVFIAKMSSRSISMHRFSLLTHRMFCQFVLSSDGQLVTCSIDGAPQVLWSTFTPQATVFNSLLVSAALDCVVLFNTGAAKSPMLIYTTQLQLRGEVTVRNVLHCVISNYGIIVVSRDNLACVLPKYDSCGTLLGPLRIEEVM